METNLRDIYVDLAGRTDQANVDADKWQPGELSKRIRKLADAKGIDGEVRWCLEMALAAARWAANARAAILHAAWSTTTGSDGSVVGVVIPAKWRSAGLGRRVTLDELDAENAAIYAALHVLSRARQWLPEPPSGLAELDAILKAKFPRDDPTSSGQTRPGSFWSISIKTLDETWPGWSDSVPPLRADGEKGSNSAEGE